jgi:hypothetical protein
MSLYKKNLLFRSHPRSLVYAAAVSLVLIGHIRTTCRPKPCPSPPPPYLSPIPARDNKRTGVGRGGAAVGHLLPPVLRPRSLTALTHHICQRLLPYLIGHPSMERTPLSEPPEPEMSPPLEQRSFGGERGGGCQGEEKKPDGGGGGGAGERMCCLKYLLSEKKFTGPLHLILSTFLFE